MQNAGMDPLQALKTAEPMGFALPTPAYLFGALLFGLIDWGTFRTGRRQQRPCGTWIGEALMLYPYLVSQTWLMFGTCTCTGTGTGLWVGFRG